MKDALLIIKWKAPEGYLASLVNINGGAYENKRIGETPQEAADYYRKEKHYYSDSLDLSAPEEVRMLLTKCDTARAGAGKVAPL
jgi:hypothetical protein